MFSHAGDDGSRAFGQLGHGGQQQPFAGPLGGGQFPRFGVQASSSSSVTSPADESMRRHFGSMDWEPSPSPALHSTSTTATTTSPFGVAGSQQPAEDVELQDLGPVNAGVRNLVAHFENIRAPVMTARVSPPVSSPTKPSFGGFGAGTSSSMVVSPTSMASPAAAIPTPTTIASPTPHFSTIGSLAASSSLASPTLASPAAAHFGSVNAIASSSNHQVTSPTLANPPLVHYGSVSALASSSNQVTSPTLASPSVAHFGSVNAMAGSSRVTSPMANAMPQAFFRPPVPMKPKPLVPQHRGPASFTFVPDGVNGGSVQVVHHAHGQMPSPFSTTVPMPIHTANNASSLIPQSPTTPSLVQQPPIRTPFNLQSPFLSPAPAGPPSSSSSAPAPTPASFFSVSSPTVVSPPATTFPAPSPVMDGSRFSSQPLAQPQGTRSGSLALRPQTGTRPSREQVPAEAWESFKHTIKQLYLEERRPLKEVMQIMADRYGFQATPKMYKTRFSQWGFVKNNTEDEVKRLLSMKFQRDAEGKVSEFVRNGRVVNLGTYLKRKGVTEYDLVDFETPADLPSYVRCRTPTPPPAPGYLRSPDLLRAQETVVGNMRKAFLHCRQFELETNKVIGWTSLVLWGAGSSEMLYDASKLFERQEHDQAGHLLMRAFKQLELDLKQLSPQAIKELLLGMVHRDSGMMTALSKYLAAYSTTNFERAHPLRQIFTCLYEVQQKHGPVTLSDLVWGCIPTVAEELEAIYGRRHPYVARTWIDLAVFYGHADPERIDKLTTELTQLRRAVVEPQEGANSAEDLCLRYGVVQLLNAAFPAAEDTRQSTVELWEAMRQTGQVYRVRGPESNVYCYHSLVKVDPYTKRARDRYEIGVQFIQKHCDVRVLPYFEEDMHHVEHAVDPQDSWASAVHSNLMPASRWTLI